MSEEQEDITFEQASRTAELIRYQYEVHMNACALCSPSEGWLCPDAHLLQESHRLWLERKRKIGRETRVDMRGKS